MSTPDSASDKGDGHRHLAVVASAPPAAQKRTALRWGVVVLAAGAIALYVASLFLPWWDLTLYAPQYPHGLHLTISLTGMGGDVREINMLNHYIGMGNLDEAAKHERELAGWGVGLIGVLILGIALIAGRKTGKLLVVPGIMFPVVFLADAYYWMYHFGHTLDPHAPLHVAPFTPQLFGNGEIGQFLTFATPSAGFWLAIGGVVLLGASTLMRRKVCNDCADKASCGAVCPRGRVGPHRPPAEPS